MIDVTLFGPTVVTDGVDRLTAPDLGGTKVRQLLEMLAWDLGTPLSKDLIAERMWEGRPPASHIATIESYVCVLRRRLGLGSGRRGALATTSHGYVLDPEVIRVDAVQVRDLLQVGHVVQALDLVTGDLLLDEPYAAWANDARDAFAQALADRCTRAAGQANATRDFELGVRLALQATAHSCYSEAAARELMRAYVGTGNRVRALRAYETLRKGMVDDLGLVPEAETQALHLEVLHGSDDVDRHGGADEISSLLTLLRSALESGSAAVVDRPAMHEVGRLLLARAV